MTNPIPFLALPRSPASHHRLSSCRIATKKLFCLTCRALKTPSNLDPSHFPCVPCWQFCIAISSRTNIKNVQQSDIGVVEAGRQAPTRRFLRTWFRFKMLKLMEFSPQQIQKENEGTTSINPQQQAGTKATRHMSRTSRTWDMDVRHIWVQLHRLHPVKAHGSQVTILAGAHSETWGIWDAPSRGTDGANLYIQIIKPSDLYKQFINISRHVRTKNLWGQ